MKPRQPTASLTSGTSYDRTAFYDLPLSYDFTITNGGSANRVIPVATTHARTVASAKASQRTKATASAKPRPIPTATMKVR